MATIVRHRESGERFVFLGSGYGVHKSYKPQMQILGALLSSKESGEIFVACLCKADGAITWELSAELEVESVDGVAPGELLAR